MIRKTASEIINHVQTCFGELAYEMAEEYKKTGTLYDEKWKTEIERLKKKGVTDIGGALGDSMYNDPGSLEDLLGDQIHDAGSNEAERLKVIENLSESESFPVWNEVMAKLKAMNWNI